MKTKFSSLVIANLLLIVACKNSTTKTESMVYPKTAKVDTTDTYFGVKVADPYRWLEDDNSAETKEWTKQQNELTFSYLSKITDREKIKQRLTQLWAYEKMGTPTKKGEWLIFAKNNGTQNQSVLFAQKNNESPIVVVDPNLLAADGTTSITGYYPTPDGNYIAYGLSKAGSDWTEFYVFDLKTQKLLTDHINWTKFSGIAWKGDGFYYSGYSKPKEGTELSGKNQQQKVYYHKLGDTQEKDQLVYEDSKNTLLYFGVQTSKNGKYLLLWISEGTSGTMVKVKDLSKANSDFIALVDDFTGDFDANEIIGEKLFVVTNRNAPKFQLVEFDLAKPTTNAFKTVIPEGNYKLETLANIGDKFIVSYQENVSSKCYVYSLQGERLKEIALPGIGTSTNFGDSDSICYMPYTTFISPTSILAYNINTGELKDFFKPKMDFNSDAMETKQVFYTSKDGTKIPMFITHKKGIKLDGSNPTFLYGYGGFDASLTPEFRVDRALFLENGGVYAVANLRGGGEMGADWHKAGTKCNKQNVFDDFIAASDYLVNEKYTTRDKLAIHGRSNGGLLVGAVMTQRPDIAKVALPVVGVLDMLRYHKFTIGWGWAPDYGTSDNKEEFECLYKYSPLHNVKEVSYPATLILTADHDDRVVPAHSFKFAATLQEKQKGNEPILIRVESNAGHGAGKPTSKLVDEFTDMWSFVFYNLGMSVK
ncbi:MAG: S9 family peptidase [Bacteroidetes bacterium]|nr:S9 family peptidase [Bacteroidota bacterium]